MSELGRNNAYFIVQYTWCKNLSISVKNLTSDGDISTYFVYFFSASLPLFYIQKL